MNRIIGRSAIMRVWLHTEGLTASRGRMFSAKGAVFNLEPEGKAPGFLEIQTPALKARFTFRRPKSWIESRFQRLFTRTLNS